MPVERTFSSADDVLVSTDSCGVHGARAVLKEAGAELAPGGAGGSQGDALSALASDVLLRREFVESVVGALDPAARAAARQRPV